MMASVPAVSVLLVDDQAPFRLAAKAVFTRLQEFEVIGEASSGEEAVSLARDLHPSLVLMDLSMPGINGIEATRRILSADPGVTVILCSTYELADLPSDAATSGAKAYVHKEQLGTETVRRLWQQRHSDTFGPT
jgi:two-component system, NarL family, invasion response regulator UvrY